VPGIDPSTTGTGSWGTANGKYNRGHQNMAFHKLNISMTREKKTSFWKKG